MAGPDCYPAYQCAASRKINKNYNAHIRCINVEIECDKEGNDYVLRNLKRWRTIEKSDNN